MGLRLSRPMARQTPKQKDLHSVMVKHLEKLK